MRERIPVNVGSVWEMAGTSGDVFWPDSGGTQRNLRLSDRRSMTHLCWQTLLACPHTDGPEDPANVRSTEGIWWLRGYAKVRGIHYMFQIVNQSYRLVEELAARWPHRPVRCYLTTELQGSGRHVCSPGRWIASFLHSSKQNPEMQWTDLTELVLQTVPETHLCILTIKVDSSRGTLRTSLARITLACKEENFTKNSCLVVLPQTQPVQRAGPDNH